MRRIFQKIEGLMIFTVMFSIAGCQQESKLPPPVSLSSVSHSESNPSPEKSEVALDKNESKSWIPNVESKTWKYIVVHHTASFQGSVESIHRTHLKRKDSKGNPWRGIGYHFVIGNGTGMGDGEVEPTFRWIEQQNGAHAGVGEYNAQGIGICFVGNFEEISPSPAQIESAKRLITYLKTSYSISTSNVIGHSDVKATACPGQFLILEEINGVDDSN